jgi:hypothetical protein
MSEPLSPEQIKTELAELDQRIAKARAPTHPFEAMQLRQAQQRAEMLRAELKRLGLTAPVGASKEN